MEDVGSLLDEDAAQPAQEAGNVPASGFVEGPHANAGGPQFFAEHATAIEHGHRDFVTAPGQTDAQLYELALGSAAIEGAYEKEYFHARCPMAPE